MWRSSISSVKLGRLSKAKSILPKFVECNWKSIHILQHNYVRNSLPSCTYRYPYNSYQAGGFRIASFSRKSNPSNPSPYDLLNVPTTATAKEIKLAYFREAKKWHPDMNPNDPSAKDKFQKIAAAYELLSDEKRRKIYDATGRSNEPMYGAGDAGDAGGSNYDPNAGAQHAEDVFNSVKEDMDVVKEAFVLYTEEVKEELQYAVSCARTGDWQGLYEVAKDHKFLIMGVVVPTVVFLRYPPAVFVVLRVLWAVSNVVLLQLLRTGNMTMAARMVWRAIVKLSNEQRARAKTRKGKGGGGGES